MGDSLDAPLLRAMVDSVDEGILVLNPNYTITFVNGPLTRLIKWNREELVGKTCHEVFYNRESVCDDCPVQKAINSGAPASAVHGGRNADGAGINVTLSAYPVTDSEGQINQIIATVRDIKPLTELEKMLIEKGRELSTVFDNAPIGISILDKEMRIIRINKFIEDIVGLKSDEVRGEHCYDVVGQYRNDPKKRGRERLCDVCNVVKALETGEIQTHLREYSPELVVENTGVPLKEDGKVIGVMEIIRDVTTEKVLGNELVRSEAKYHTLLEKMNEGFGIIDSQNRLTMANKKLAEMLEYDVSELVGRDLVTLFDAKNKEVLTKELKKRRQGEASVYEVEFTTKGGRQLPTLVSATPLLDDEGKYEGAFAVITDMTEKKRLEDELREYAEKLEDKVEEKTKELKRSEGKYRGMMASSPDAFFVMDKGSNKIIDINDAACELLGYSRDEIIGTNAGSRVVPSQINAFKREYGKLKKIGRFSGEFDLRRKDGTTVSVEVKGSAFGDYLFAFARDITARKKADEALRNSEERYRTLAEAAHDMIFIIDRRDRVQYVNSFAAEQFGLKPKDVIGKPRKSLFPIDVSDRQKHALQKVFRTGKAVFVESMMPFRGKELWLGTWLVPLKYDSGEVNAVLGISRDITERKRAEEELRASENRLRAIINAEPECVKMVALDGTLLDMNPAGLSMIEADSLEQVRGKSIYPLVAPQYRSAFKTFMEAVFRGMAGKMEFEIIGIKGTRLWLETHAVPLRDERNKITSLLSVTRDVTERKRAEQKLRESEETYRTLFQNANDGVVTIDLDGRYRLPNPKFCEITGYSREELEGKHSSEIVHPDDLPVVEKNRRARLRGAKAAESYEYRIVCKDGKIKYVETRPSVVAKEDKIIGFQTIIRDITDKKRQERELSALLDISQNVAATLDLSSLVDTAVKKIVEATGADRVSVVLFDKEGHAHVPAAYTKSGEKTGVGNVFNLADFKRMKEAVEKRKTVYVPNALDAKTQTPVAIAVAKKLNIGSGVHVPLIARDKVIGILNFSAVGKAREFKEHEIEFYETIANQLSAMIANAMLYDETKLSKNEAEFYVDLMSHDINNANTVAMGMLELLADSRDLEDRKNFVRKSIMAIRRSANLIDNVRKIQMAKLTGKRAFEDLNLDALLREVIADVKNFHADKDVMIRYTPKKARIFADGLSRDLFWNILDNAAKYDPHGVVKIDVKVADAGRNWLVSIRDRGRGIPDDFKIAIFERFRRLDTGVRGSGVGLYLCKLLVEKYGGRIWVENRVKGDYKRGSVFNVALPKA